MPFHSVEREGIRTFKNNPRRECKRLFSSTIQILLRPASFVPADYFRFARHPTRNRLAREIELRNRRNWFF
jgi:hypothetical protein